MACPQAGIKPHRVSWCQQTTSGLATAIMFASMHTHREDSEGWERRRKEEKDVMLASAITSDSGFHMSMARCTPDQVISPHHPNQAPPLAIKLQVSVLFVRGGYMMDAQPDALRFFRRHANRHLLPTCKLNPFFDERAASMRTLATGGRPGTRSRQARAPLPTGDPKCLSPEFSIKSPSRTPPMFPCLPPDSAHCMHRTMRISASRILLASQTKHYTPNPRPCI